MKNALSRFRYLVALVVITAVALSSLMMVNTDRADAIAQECPVSSSVFLDDEGCFRRVPRPTTGSCPAGTTLDPGGTLCREPVALVTETITEDPACPDGFAVNADLAGICSRVEPAQQSDPLCPRGSRGTAGACYVASTQYECPEGVLSGDACTILAGVPLRGPATCPVHPNVIFDGTDCYTVVDEINGVCQVGSVPDPAGGCRLPVDLRAGEKFCEEGGLINSRCLIIEPAVPLPCAAGETDDFGLCRLPVDDRTSEWFCVGAAQELQGETCVGTSSTSDAAASTFCADGSVPYSEASGTCVFTSKPSELPPGCPEGARGVRDGCYVLLAKDPASEAGCSRGILIDATCVVAGAPPIYTAEGPTCGAGFIPVAGQCQSFSAPERVPPQCPQATIEVLDGSCRKPVANARGARYCPNPVASLADTLCLLVVPALVTTDGAPCPVGFSPDGAGACETSEPAYSTDTTCPDSTFRTAGGCVFYSGPGFGPGGTCVEGTRSGSACRLVGEPLTYDFQCPISSTVFVDGDDCYTLVVATEQVDGTRDCGPLTPDPNGIECRRPVAKRQVAASCASPYTFTGSSCHRFISPEPAVALCPTAPPAAADNVCWFQTTPASGRFFCADPTALLNDRFAAERTCTTTADFSTTCTGEEALAGQCGRPRPACPDGYTPDDSLGGLCARTEPAQFDSTGEEVCPDPMSTRYPLGGGRCVFTTAFIAPCDPVQDACGIRTIQVCPLSETVMADEDECFRPVGFACPQGSFPETDPTTCRVPIILALRVNLISQTSAGVLGADGTDDVAGSALAEGDFNADGYADVAIGTPGDANARGGVAVLYGSSTGLLESEGAFTDQTGGTNGAEPGDLYGAAIAAGDFNGDGADDLAVGAPGETVAGLTGAGAVSILYGVRGGGFSAPFTFDGSATFMPGAAEATDEFGGALHAADFNGDGRDDLAIGVPGEALGRRSDAGAVIVLYGSLFGIQRSGAKWLSGDSAGVPGIGESDDRFGSAFAAADFDGNGTVDLAVGVPGEALGRRAQAGAVIVFDGTANGVVSTGAQWLSGDSRGTPGVGETGDRFGAALVAGEFNGDGMADLAVGVPGEALGSKNDAGAVIVFTGAPTGVRTSGAKWLSGDSPGVPGIGEAGDLFGAALAASDLDGNGTTDLAVGVPGEGLGSKTDAGAVIVFPGTGSGITTAGSVLISGDSRPLPGIGEAGDEFGSALAAAPYDGIGAGLVVGVPGEDIGRSVRTGAVIELPHQYQN